MKNTYYVKVSPENLKSDIFEETYSGVTFGVYSGMSYVLSGNTDGTSFLTGLTIPIVFNQTYDDLGYYTSFDGFVLQKDVVSNFLYSGNTTTPYTVNIYNTSDKFKKFLELSSYNIDWGDGYSEIITELSPDFLSHQYDSVPTGYTVTLTQTNPWGTTKIQKTITVPFENVIIDNPFGNVTFTPMGGSWSGIPINYNFYFYGLIVKITYRHKFLQVILTFHLWLVGFTTSKISNLRLYGPTLYNEGVMFKTIWYGLWLY